MKLPFFRPARGLATRTAALLVASACTACGGGSAEPSSAPSSSADTTVTKSLAPAATETVSAAESLTQLAAMRLLTQATFGPSPQDVASARTLGAAAWVDRQLAMPHDPARGHVAYIAARVAAGEASHQNLLFRNFWKQALTAPDQLRQRTAFALSQIFVVSLASDLGDLPVGVGSYYDMLSERSFGTYRQLLDAVARHPMMGVYLSHLQNQKENPATGRVPDENFAREVLQLFSIGLVQLNLDGTPKAGAGGQPVETYTNADVQGLAKVFTGWSWAGPDQSESSFRGWSTATVNRHVTPMQAFPAYHSASEKKFLGVTIPAQATPDPAASLKVALDTIAAHPNVGPFLGRQLIQRLVTSNPSPAYVARVATVFNNNGSGVRGDLKAVVRAVLLDPEARDDTPSRAAGYGKVREPLLRMSAWLRAFEATSRSGRFLVRNTDDAASALGQTVLRSPSVFNFFRPEHVPQGAGGLQAPEMQIATEVSAAGYVNLMQKAVFRGYGDVDATGAGDLMPDYAVLTPLARDPQALVQVIDDRLLAGRMSTALKSRILLAMASVPSIGDTASRLQFDRDRISLALLLTVVSPEFVVQR